MKDSVGFILGFVGGFIFAAMLYDMGCESVTQDRCTIGIPNPVK